MLGSAGIEEYDEQIYRALLRTPSARLADLAEATGSGPARARAALARLVELGLVRRTPQRAYVPVAPDTAIGVLVKHREAELAAVRADVLELTAEYTAGQLEANPAGIVEVVTGPEAILRRASELNDGAQTEILAFDKPPYMFEPGDREIEYEQPLLQRGVRARGIYTQEALAAPNRPAILSRLAALGEEARILPDLPFKLRVYDRRIAMIPLTTDQYATQGVAVVHQSGLLAALIALFDAYWQQAFPITGPFGDRPAELTDRDIELLRLMGAGLKDETIARQLGVSMRTVRRQVLRLMDLLPASTRFQAGARANGRGWI